VRLVDLTRPLSAATPVWPGDPPIRLDVAAAFPLVHALCLGSHSGTHLDAPRHLDPAGAALDDLDLQSLIGPAWVCDLSQLPAHGLITAADLDRAGIPAGTARLLIRTRNSVVTDRFDPGFVALAPDGAAWLRDRGLRLVGIDGPSVDPYDSTDLPAHLVLLGAGIPLVEYLDLSAASVGTGQLICLPMRLLSGDGAPVRAVLCEGPL
jgi:arylformamidase